MDTDRTCSGQFTSGQYQSCWFKRVGVESVSGALRLTYLSRAGLREVITGGSVELTTEGHLKEKLSETVHVHQLQGLKTSKARVSVLLSCVMTEGLHLCAEQCV